MKSHVKWQIVFFCIAMMSLGAWSIVYAGAPNQLSINALSNYRVENSTISFLIQRPDETDMEIWVVINEDVPADISRAGISKQKGYIGSQTLRATRKLGLRPVVEVSFGLPETLPDGVKKVTIIGSQYFVTR